MATATIPSTGSVGISNVNILKNVLSKNTSATEKSSSLSDLRDYFRDSIGVRGAANDETLTGGGISLGRFRGNYIYGFNIVATSESRDDTYFDNNDAYCKIDGTLGVNSVYSFTLGGTTLSSRSSATFSSLSGATGSGQSYTEYNASIQHRGSGDSIDFKVRIGYASTASTLVRSPNSNVDGNVPFNHNISTAQSYLVGTRLYRFTEVVDDTDKPGQVIGLNATASSESSIILDWSAEGSATSYKIYRGGVHVHTTTSTSWTNTGLTSATTYSYRVSAVNAYGEGTSSDTVSATTLQLITRFTLESRIVRDSLGNAISQDAIILDPYTNFTYTFRVKLNMVRYKPGGITENFSTTGSYVSRKYNTTNIADRISYKGFSGLDQLMIGTTFDVLTSYDILWVEVRNRTTGALVSTVWVGKNINFANDPFQIIDIPKTSGDFIASFDSINLSYALTTSGSNTIGTDSLVFDLGLNQSAALREDWSIAASGGATSVNEGASITFNTLAYNPTGAYFWRLNAAGTNGIETADFPAMSGQLATTNASNGTSSFAVTPTSDSLTEGTESFNVTIHKGNANGTLMATSGTITIGDTSQTPEAYSDQLTFTVTQQSGDIWKLYIAGTKDYRYDVVTSFRNGYDRVGVAFLQNIDPRTDTTLPRYNSGNSGRTRFIIETIALKNGASTVKTWDIFQQFFNGDNINQTSETLLDIGPISEGSTNPNKATFSVTNNNTTGSNIVTAICTVGLS